MSLGAAGDSKTRGGGQVMSGKTVAVLDGHTRTPWTLAFHRLAPHLLVSGCLNGLGILLKPVKWSSEALRISSQFSLVTLAGDI